MNWLDKTISWVSPQAGLKRTRARLISEQLLSYEGVRSDRRMGGWNTSGASGNAEISVGLPRLRDNARALCRDNAYARRAKREWTKRVVGAGGITPRADTGSDMTNRIIQESWGLFAENCCSDSRMNFYAAERLIVSSAFESGESLVRLWDRRLEDGLAVPLQLQLLESDFLDSSKNQTLKNGYIIEGIQFDPIGRITGYWLFGSHPGDPIQTSPRGSMNSAFIPAEYILHHYEPDRPGDVRAVTRFASVIAKLRDLDEYEDAEIIRKKIEACLAAFIGQAEGVEGPTLAAVAVDATTGLKVEEMRPGMIMYGQPGTKPEFFAPPATGDYSAYKKTELREVASGLEIPYVLLDDNLEAVNYSSFRGGLLAFRDAINDYRENYLIPQILNPIWRRFIDKLFVMGKIPALDYSVRWDAPPFDLLDRAAEAEADRCELALGKKTWPQFIGEQGNDPDAQIDEIGKWNQRLKEAGVTFAKSISANETPSGGATQTGETQQ